MKKILLLIGVLTFTFSVTPIWAQKYDYDKAGRLVQVTYAKGKKLYYYYDKAGNLISVTDSKKGHRKLRAKG